MSNDTTSGLKFNTWLCRSSELILRSLWCRKSANWIIICEGDRVASSNNFDVRTRYQVQAAISAHALARQASALSSEVLPTKFELLSFPTSKTTNSNHRQLDKDLHSAGDSDIEVESTLNPLLKPSSRGFHFVRASHDAVTTCMSGHLR